MAKKTEKEFTPKFHDGDQVEMVDCLEAENNKGKVWSCRGEVVFLQGYRGYFDAECLRKV